MAAITADAVRRRNNITIRKLNSTNNVIATGRNRYRLRSVRINAILVAGNDVVVCGRDFDSAIGIFNAVGFTVDDVVVAF